MVPPLGTDRIKAPYRSRTRDADGSIIPAIITAHIIQMRRVCVASHRVIIHALGPFIGPYMSRATTKIQSHETALMTPSSAIGGVRGWRMTVSTHVARRGAEAVPFIIGFRLRQSYACGATVN